MSSEEPIFKPIFNKSWDSLPPVMLKHYANKPYSTDLNIVEGKMEIFCKKYLKPLFWLIGTAPAFNEVDVPVTVEFSSVPDGKDFCFNRIFHFKNHKTFHFRSRLTQVKDNEVKECMSYGICWHCYYSWDGKKITLQHKGYSWQIGRIKIPLPVTWLMGRCDANEWPIDENTFDMCATINHPILGKVYEYKGRFKVVE